MQKGGVLRLEKALREAFPAGKISVTAHGARLTVDATGPRGGEISFHSPAAMDYTALSMEEWLHRFTALLSTRL